MRTILILLLTLITSVSGSCEREKSNTETEPPGKNPNEQFADIVTMPMYVLIDSNSKIDIPLFIDLYKYQIEYGKGLTTFIFFASQLHQGDMPSDICAEFIKAMTEGEWRFDLEKIISQGSNFSELTDAISFLERSVEHDYPNLFLKLNDYIFSQLDLIYDPQLKAMTRISYASDFHLAGFDGMKELIIVDTDYLIEVMNSQNLKLTELDILRCIDKIAAVDIDAGTRLAEIAFKDEFLKTESEAALGAGIMLNDYEDGKKIFLEAIKSFDPSLMQNQYMQHTVFELGYIRLKDEDKKKIFDDILKVLEAFGRIPILPPVEPRIALVYEPELPAWYRDALYSFMNRNYKPVERLKRFNAELVKHSLRFPRSRHTEEFIGWMFEWLKEVKDPKERCALLGQICLSPNVIIPERVAKSLPRIMQISQGFNKIAPELDLKDLFVEALWEEDPKALKNKLIGNLDFENQDDNIMSLFAVLRARHYFYPDDGADLIEYMDSIFRKWDGGRYASEIDRKAMLVELWAGWDDDKAWKYVTEMNASEGEYPKTLVNIINSTRLYAQGFSKRCHDEFISKFKAKAFKQSNPQMEMNLVYELGRGSIDWAEDLANVIIEIRGNEPPVFSFYSLYRKIISAAMLSGADYRETERLCEMMQNTLRKDLLKFKQ